MPLSILVIGSRGRMGQLACQAIDADPSMQLVGRVDKDDDLAQCLKQSQADVAVDLTHAKLAATHAELIIDAGCRPVIGTSGLTEQSVRAIQDHCMQQHRGGIIVPNFSLGAVLAMQCAKLISQHFQHAEIIEYHHAEKQDSPSGTAIKTAEMLQNVVEYAPPHSETINGARGAVHQNVPIHSLRVPGIAAKQDVVFGHPGESLTISHNVIDRQAYMPGLLLACRAVMNLNECVYGLEHILPDLQAPSN
jgi:4-hydroxy-tetrahydrodipicolinate reductase